MTYYWRCALGVGAALFMHGAADPSLALTTSTTSITCSSKNKLQSKIDAIASGTVATINVSGTCTENISIVAGKTIYLVGQDASQGAKIVAASGAQQAVYSNGFLSIRNMTIRSSAGEVFTVQADFGGTIVLAADIVTTSSAPRVIGAFNNSTIDIRNSRISNTAASQDKTIVVDLSSSLNFTGNSNFASGPDGYQSSVSGAKDAIYCGTGSAATVIAEGTGSAIVGSSKRGINLNACNLIVENRTGTPSKLKIQNNTSGGIVSYNSHMILNGAVVSGNGKGLNSIASQALILGTTFGGPGVANTVDIWSGLDSTVDIDDFGGTTSFLNLSADSLQCFKGGHIYYAPLYVSPSLSTYNPSCVIDSTN